MLCGAEGCEAQSELDSRERRLQGWADTLDEFGRWSGAEIDGAVYRMERPPANAWLVRPGSDPDGSRDLDPFLYLPPDVAEEFVAEFGRTGAEVGQTRPSVGVTLGATTAP